jgi:peptide/nickel transport system substrate-binding protein
MLSLLAASTGLTLLAACAPISAPAPKPTTPPAPAAPKATTAPQPAAAGAAAAPAPPAAAQPAAQAKPSVGGTLRVITTADFGARGIDPHGISPTAFDTLWTVYDTLTRYDEKLQPQPMLAESWDASSDFKQVKINLRKGVTFHTGRELTSDDVKWNVERVKDPKVGAAQLIGMANWWNAIETPDKHTVILKSESPRPAVFDMFEYMNIADRETMEGPEAQTKAVGTGPFTYGEWVQGDHQRYLKNKNYWQSGKPYLDELYFQIAKDAQAAVLQVESGAVDAMLNPPVRDLARLQQDSKFRALVNQNTGEYFILAFNTTTPPFDKKEVRQAFNHAINRKRFVDSVLTGIGEPRNLPWAKQSPAYDAAKNGTYTYDPEKAKALLAKAGSPAVDADISYSSSDYEPGQLAQILHGDFTALGAKLANRSMDTAALQDLFNKAAYKGISLRFSGFAGTDPATLFTVGTYFRLNTNASAFKSERYEQLVRAVGAEPDQAKRKQIFSDLNDVLLDESFVAIVSSKTVSAVAKASVNGMAHSMHEAVIWTDAWLAG